MAEKLTLKIGGKTRTFPTINAAAKFLKIPYPVLYQRLFVLGWSKTKAITHKVVKKPRKKKSKSKKRK